MRKLILSTLFILIHISTIYAAEKSDLFDDYRIYSKDIENVINDTKKKVHLEINNIKKLMLDNKKDDISLKLNEIHLQIMNLDSYIKKSYSLLKTENMKEALEYPITELYFYEKLIKEIVSYYEKNGSITKKEIKIIENKHKEEKIALKKQADIIRNDFLKAVFD